MFWPSPMCNIRLYLCQALLCVRTIYCHRIPVVEAIPNGVKIQGARSKDRFVNDVKEQDISGPTTDDKYSIEDISGAKAYRLASTGLEVTIENFELQNREKRSPGVLDDIRDGFPKLGEAILEAFGYD